MPNIAAMFMTKLPQLSNLPRSSKLTCSSLSPLSNLHSLLVHDLKAQKFIIVTTLGILALALAKSEAHSQFTSTGP